MDIGFFLIRIRFWFEQGLPVRPIFGAVARSTQQGVNIGYPTSGRFRFFANGHFERLLCSPQRRQASPSSGDPSRHGRRSAGERAWGGQGSWHPQGTAWRLHCALCSPPRPPRCGTVRLNGRQGGTSHGRQPVSGTLSEVHRGVQGVPSSP